MKCMSSSILAVSSLLGSVSANVYAAPRELVLRVNPLDGLCELVAFRFAQIHKDLLRQDVVEEVTPIPVPRPGTTQNVLRMLSYDVPALLSQAQSHCSNDLAVLLQLAPSVQAPSAQVPFSRDATASVHLLDVDLPPLELIPLITSGPAENRVDLAFFADGYTAEERQTFVDDATRLARDLSTNQTFFTVKPLLNFWAVFTPSRESGIGVGGKAKDTPFGLYRDGTELRGLYANNSDVALAACASLGDKCNYGILLANDPLYGGIGGEYTTTTASLANGALVLRHEIGHSIIDVGEEYDGGFAYFGVNSVHDIQKAYPWTLLEAGKPWSVTFSSSGTYARHLVKFSLSGIPQAGDLAVYLDGTNLGWTPRSDIGIDRWHYDVPFESGLTVGEHTLVFVLQNQAIQGLAQLCSVEVLEFGSRQEFDSTPGYYGLFSTYDLDNATSYRPTNDGCLMRTVARPNFCSVCLEGLWLSLLKRVDLIDDLRVTCSGSSRHVVALELVALAQLREQPVERAESYVISWTQDGRVLDAFANRTMVELDDVGGIYRVDVTYAVDEVRLDTQGYLRASRTFDVTRAC